MGGSKRPAFASLSKKYLNDLLVVKREKERLEEEFWKDRNSTWDD
jgi:hypothetical protein